MLVYRFNSDTTGNETCSADGQTATPTPLSDFWQNITVAYSASTIPQFNNAQIVNYFVTRTDVDGLQCGDFKTINQSATNLFWCGHVQQIEVASDEEHVFLRAMCLPETRKDCTYELLVNE